MRLNGSVSTRRAMFRPVEHTHGKGDIARHQEQTVMWITLPNGLDLPSTSDDN